MTSLAREYVNLNAKLDDVEKIFEDTLILINEDGTEVSLPENPLKEKWESLYPPIHFGEPCSPILGYYESGVPLMNYSCVLCTEKKCPHSSHWEIPKEDKEMWDAYQRQVNAYLQEHNPAFETCM